MTKEIRCEKCGVFNPEYRKCCQFCGAPLKPTNYEEGEIETKDLPRPKPKPKPKYCQFCGVENPGKVDFCYKCGKKLEEPNKPLKNKPLKRKETISKSISGIIVVFAFFILVISMLNGNLLK